MKQRDPVHFFDDKGHSWLSRDHLVAENERLQAKVQELERIVLMQQQRWRLFNPDVAAAPSRTN